MNDVSIEALWDTGAQVSTVSKNWSGQNLPTAERDLIGKQLMVLSKAGLKNLLTINMVYQYPFLLPQTL